MISIDNQLKQSINKSRSTIIWNSIENFLEKKKKKFDKVIVINLVKFLLAK